MSSSPMSVFLQICLAFWLTILPSQAQSFLSAVARGYQPPPNPPFVDEYSPNSPFQAQPQQPQPNQFAFRPQIQILPSSQTMERTTESPLLINTLIQVFSPSQTGQDRRPAIALAEARTLTAVERIGMTEGTAEALGHLNGQHRVSISRQLDTHTRTFIPEAAVNPRASPREIAFVKAFAATNSSRMTKAELEAELSRELDEAVPLILEQLERVQPKEEEKGTSEGTDLEGLIGEGLAQFGEGTTTSQQGTTPAETEPTTTKPLLVFTKTGWMTKAGMSTEEQGQTSTTPREEGQGGNTIPEEELFPAEQTGMPTETSTMEIIEEITTSTARTETTLASTIGTTTEMGTEQGIESGEGVSTTTTAGQSLSPSTSESQSQTSIETTPQPSRTIEEIIPEGTSTWPFTTLIPEIGSYTQIPVESSSSVGTMGSTELGTMSTMASIGTEISSEGIRTEGLGESGTTTSEMTSWVASQSQTTALRKTEQSTSTGSTQTTPSTAQSTESIPSSEIPVQPPSTAQSSSTPTETSTGGISSTGSTSTAGTGDEGSSSSPVISSSQQITAQSESSTQTIGLTETSPTVETSTQQPMGSTQTLGSTGTTEIGTTLGSEGREGKLTEFEEGRLWVQCLPGQIKSTFHPWANRSFEKGVLFAKDYHQDPNCYREIGQGQSEIQLEANEGQCGLARMESVDPPGTNLTLVLMFTARRTLVLGVPEHTFLVHCFVPSLPSQSQLSADLAIEGLPPSLVQTISLELSPPKCEYTLRRDSPNGPLVDRASLGQTIFHRWECQGGVEGSAVFGLVVTDCVVANISAGQDQSGTGSLEVVDPEGCSTDPTLVDHPQYAQDHLLAFARASVFSLRQADWLRFSCRLTLCLRREGGCDGLTPPNCPNSSIVHQGLVLARRHLPMDQSMLEALSQEVLSPRFSIGPSPSRQPFLGPPPRKALFASPWTVFLVLALAVLLGICLGLVTFLLHSRHSKERNARRTRLVQWVLARPNDESDSSEIDTFYDSPACPEEVERQSGGERV